MTFYFFWRSFGDHDKVLIILLRVLGRDSNKHLLFRCLNKDPAKRPSVQEIKKDPFFKKAKDRAWIMDHLVLKVGPLSSTFTKFSIIFHGPLII